MAEDIVMPELGQTVSEGKVVEWLVEAGELVELGQPLLVVETDKAEVEVESAAEGILAEIMVHAGSTVEAGTVIARVTDPGEGESPA